MTYDSVIGINNNKIDRYIKLLFNRKLLVNSSKCLIKKKKSRLARKINKGDFKAIKYAAKSKFLGSLTKEQRTKLCKLLCDFRERVKSRRNGETIREIVAYAITLGIGLLDSK